MSNPKPELQYCFINFHDLHKNAASQFFSEHQNKRRLPDTAHPSLSSEHQQLRPLDGTSNTEFQQSWDNTQALAF